MLLKYQDKTLNLCGHEIVLPYSIENVLERHGVVIVLFKYYKTTNRNIYAFNNRGEKIWEVQEAPNLSYEERPFTSIRIENDMLIAHNWVGVEYSINLDKGTVTPYGTGKRPW